MSEPGQTTRDPRTYEILGAAMAVDRTLGCGFLETIYQQALGVISNDVVHSGLLGKNGRYHTFRSFREEAPSEASS